MKNQSNRTMFNQIRNTTSNTVQRCDAMNNILNLMDNTLNNLSNNHIDCNKVEDNILTVSFLCIQ